MTWLNMQSILDPIQPPGIYKLVKSIIWSYLYRLYVRICSPECFLPIRSPLAWRACNFHRGVHCPLQEPNKHLNKQAWNESMATCRPAYEQQRRGQEWLKFAVQMWKQQSCMLCSNVFHFYTFRSRFRPFHNVKWPVLQLCGPCKTIFKICVLHNSKPLKPI